METPRDPLLEPLVRRLGPWGFPFSGLAWSLVWELAALLILRSLGLSGRLFDQSDPALRGSVRASTWLLDVVGPSIIWALYGWLRRASSTLIPDLNARRIFLDESPRPETGGRNHWIAGSAARYAWIAGLAIAGAGAVQHAIRPPGWNEASMLHAQLRLVVSIPLWYTLWMCVVTLGATIAALRNAFRRHPLRVYAFHPDGFAGLGPLHVYIRTLIYFILAISGLLAIAVALATVTAQLSATKIDRILVIYVFGFFVVAPAGLFGTIWPAHGAMVRTRARLEHAVAQLVVDQTRGVQTLADPLLTTADLDRFDVARRAQQLLRAFPTWPVNPVGLRGVMVGIFSPLFIGILTDIAIRLFLRGR